MTGMTIPAWLWVRALNCLQNSMMFTPCGPSAVPTGGAGLAAPAGHCSLTIALTFLAILVSPQLQVVHFDGRRAPEEAHRHLDLALFGEDFLHGAAEIGEGTLGDLHRLSHHERNLFLGRGLRSFLRDAEEAIDLFGAERLGRAPGADKLDDALHAVDQVLGLLAHRGLDQHVARIELP